MATRLLIGGVAALTLLVSCTSGDDAPSSAASTTEVTSSSAASGSGGASSGSLTTSSAGGAAGQGGAGGEPGAGGGEPTPPVCGDGLVKAPEQCDDRNALAGDGCENDCTRTKPVCGNGDVEPGELCDDGPSDKCAGDCTFDTVKAPSCAAAIDLSDPKLVTKQGAVTTYAGTTVGGLKGFGSAASCTQKSLAAAVRLHRFTAPSRGAYRFETVTTAGGLTDTVLWAYGDCLDTGATTACVDDLSGGTLSGFSAFLPKGTTLYLVVGGVGSGAYTLQVTQLSSCGDGVVGVGEVCDDGGVLDGDGCSSKCAPELTQAEVDPNEPAAKAQPYASDTLARVDPQDDLDWFTLVVPPGKSRIAAWVLPVFGGSCDGAKKSETMLGSVLAEVELYKDDGSTKVKTSDLYDPCPVLKVKGLDPGAYRLKVRGNSMFCPKCRFEYRLHVDLQD